MQTLCDDTVVSRHSKESENSRCKISQSVYVQSHSNQRYLGMFGSGFAIWKFRFERVGTPLNTPSLNIQDVEVYIGFVSYLVLHVFSCCFVGLLNPLRCVWQQQQTVPCSNMPTIIIFTMIYSCTHTHSPG